MVLTAEELGQRIAEARGAANLTQQQVADALEVPRSAISLIESGQRQVTSLELLRLSKILRAEVQDILEGKSDLNVLFRMEPRLEDSAIRQAVQAAFPLCDVLRELDELITSEEGLSEEPWHGRDIPIVKSALNAQGQELARRERERLRLGFGPIGDLAGLLFSQGVAVAEHDLPEGLSGFYIHIRKRPFILVRSDEVAWRRRFSLAHELGHALMDADQRVVVSREGDQSARERRANAFAGAFLLPKEGILQFTSNLGIDPETMDFTQVVGLATQFGVSYDAAVVQLYQQGVISLKQKRALETKSANARGYRGKLKARDPPAVKTTLHQWVLLRMGRAYELELISTRRALSIGRMVGQSDERTVEQLQMFARESAEDE